MPLGRDFFCGWTLLWLYWVGLLLGLTAFSSGPKVKQKKKKNQLLPTSSIPPNMIKTEASKKNTTKKTEASGTSLAVQRLRLHASTAAFDPWLVNEELTCQTAQPKNKSKPVFITQPTRSCCSETGTPVPAFPASASISHTQGFYLAASVPSLSRRWDRS